MEPEEAKRARDTNAAAKRDGFESGVAWSICGAVWGFFLSAFALAFFAEFDDLDLGAWKAFIAIAILAAAAWIWWLPMREARRQMRDGGL